MVSLSWKFQEATPSVTAPTMGEIVRYIRHATAAETKSNFKFLNFDIKIKIFKI